MKIKSNSVFAYILIIIVSLLPFSALAAKSDNSRPKNISSLQGVKHWSNPDYTRISLELDRDTTFETHRIGKSKDGGERVYIDIHRAVTGKANEITIGDGLLKSVRIAQYKPATLRVVLDIESMKDFKVFPLSDPSRIIIDVRGDRPSGFSKLEPEIKKLPETSSVPVKTAPTATIDKPEKKEKKTKQKPAISKIRRVVVDPGHGGHDPGAVGPNGIQEKDVVLSIGLKLKELLADELELDVVMTRSTDIFIPLEERTAIANKVGADLFISVHANAAPNKSASGIETYYLNLAKTDKVAQLAAKENGTTLEKVSVLQAVLFDLMANYKLNDSAHLADEVQKSLYKKIKGDFGETKNLGVKQGPFYVLVGAAMPSILVETAFLSNREEEKRLQSISYHEAAAEGIAEGVKGYINSLK